MKKLKMKCLLITGLIGLIGCADKTQEEKITPVLKEQTKKVFQEGSVYVDNKFDGARLNDFTKLNDSTYQIKISPENTPINNSPWFGFRIWSKQNTNVDLEIAYTDGYRHRYIPKLSVDGVLWEPLEKASFEIDSVSGSIHLKLSLTPNKLWICAQENINSNHLNNWMDSLAKADFIEKEKVGESALGRPINLLKINEGISKQSIILIGRQHPPEVPGGTISLKTFVHSILSNSELASNFRKQFEIIVFPLLNPDGVDNGNWRHNANGKDLNRDWVLFSQPETSVVKDWILNSKKSNPERNYCFGMDFHTSYSGPYLLTLDTIPHKVKPDITAKWINRIEFLTKDTLDIRPRSQSLPYCYNWLINEIGIEAVTFEEGDEIERTIVKRRAENYANALMETLMDRYN